ncbi:hypothetical protein PybrP1_010584 [[Pythium] brassicae (nom. inval.)]|nr:hypothetical protein PybrP1_010584 [[Pythium] brassicae (nom. inval.)]
MDLRICAPVLHSSGHSVCRADNVPRHTSLHLQAPSRFKGRERAIKFAAGTMRRVKDVIQREMKFYSLTSDIWLSITTDSFMSLTLHYMTADFRMREFTLMVKLLRGHHTGNAVLVALSSVLMDFGIEKERLVFVLRDNGFNMVKACDDWGVAISGCIGHCLHLVVRSFLIKRRGHSEEPTEMNEGGQHDNQLDHHNEEEDTTADYSTDFIDPRAEGTQFDEFRILSAASVLSRSL